MRAIIFLALVLTAVCSANAVSDSIAAGPYEVSFDIGLNRSDYRSVVDGPMTTETLGGYDITRYEILILNASNEAVYSQISSIDSAADLIATKELRILTILITEFKEALPVVLTPTELKDMLEGILRGDPRVSDIRSDARAIDGVDGAVSSAVYSFNPSLDGRAEVYMALYPARFDSGQALVEIISYFPWDEGTLQLLKTISVQRVH